MKSRESGLSIGEKRDPEERSRPLAKRAARARERAGLLFRLMDGANFGRDFLEILKVFGRFNLCVAHEFPYADQRFVIQSGQ